MKSIRRITSHRSPVASSPQHAKSACHPVPAECQALLGETLRQLFAFACPSYPCSGFPEPTGALTTHRPFGSRNSSPMTYPSGCGRQYATRARARKPPGNDSKFSVSLVRQRRTLGTRAPRELTSSVNVVSMGEADWCPEIWTATVIGILFSSRSTANVCGIVSLSTPACSPLRRIRPWFSLQTGRDAGQRANPVRPSLHSIQRPVRGIEQTVNRFPVPRKYGGANAHRHLRKFAVLRQPLTNAPAHRGGRF